MAQGRIFRWRPRISPIFCDAIPFLLPRRITFFYLFSFSSFFSLIRKGGLWISSIESTDRAPLVVSGVFTDLPSPLILSRCTNFLQLFRSSLSWYEFFPLPLGGPGFQPAKRASAAAASFPSILSNFLVLLSSNHCVVSILSFPPLSLRVRFYLSSDFNPTGLGKAHFFFPAACCLAFSPPLTPLSFFVLFPAKGLNLR